MDWFLYDNILRYETVNKHVAERAEKGRGHT